MIKDTRQYLKKKLECEKHAQVIALFKAKHSVQAGF